jgi:epoxyqueuosine reductase QueG
MPLAMIIMMFCEKRGLDLLHHIQEAYGPVKGRFFTDSAPILEKAWAERAVLAGSAETVA